jgi:hypothetical protein
VLPLPDELLLKHATLYEDYKNTTHWPKHVLVHYRFHDEGDVDFNKGLYVLLTTGGGTALHSANKVWWQRSSSRC